MWNIKQTEKNFFQIPQRTTNVFNSETDAIVTVRL